MKTINERDADMIESIEMWLHEIEPKWVEKELAWLEELRTRLAEEPVSDDLEDEIDRVIADYSFTKTIDSGGFKTTVLDYVKIARHSYELGRNARKEDKK